MAYNANIPQPADQLSQSQPQLLANFQAISTLINVNHNDFGSPNQGKHFFVEFPVQASDQVTVASEVGVYCKTSAFSGVPALFLRRQTNGTVVEWTTAVTTSTDGWTRLPSNILLKWGIATVGPGMDTVTYPVGASEPVFISVITVLTSVENGSGVDENNIIYSNNYTTTTFDTYSVEARSATTKAGTLNYLAIGF